MTETAGPDKVASADQIGLSAREAAAPPPRDAAEAALPRDVASWAKKVDRLQVDPRHGVRGTNVAGRRLTGPVQGFGKMWQKTYRMDAGPDITPEQAIATWREHFPEFWPKGNRFAGALTGINPGDVALLDLAIGGGVKLSTGVFVLYADAESFTLMTPQGHMLAGWITFSAEREREADTTTMKTTVQAQVLMRANDPLYEIAMTLGGHRKEDKFWAATLTALGQRLGIKDPKVETRSTCVDSKRQWRHSRNVWHNSMVRSVLQTIAAPVTGLGRLMRGTKSQASG
ncbi:MAG TPA: hypothetical protein VF951_04705 [Streptosporangiaceae bacterium]